MKKKGMKAIEIIAWHFSSDADELKNRWYSTYREPTIYVVGEDYYCCPTKAQKLPDPHHFKWKKIESFTTEHTGRFIYECKIDDHIEDE